MRIVPALAFLLASFPAIADPAPFGLELGKATVTKAKSLYDLTSTGTNKFSDGPMFSVDTSEVDFEGLQELTLIFDVNETLVGVLATLPKHKFKALLESLSKKYQVVTKTVPFVGNASAKYVDGATEIRLDAPHMSFELSMNYIRKELADAFARQSATEAQEKKRSEESQL